MVISVLGSTDRRGSITHVPIKYNGNIYDRTSERPLFISIVIELRIAHCAFM